MRRRLLRALWTAIMTLSAAQHGFGQSRMWLRAIDVLVVDEAGPDVTSERRSRALSPPRISCSSVIRSN